ncbi:MAG: protein kinase, partial [Gemmatimonadales bacterium]
HSAGEIAETLYYTMPFIEGPSARAVLEQVASGERPPLSVREVLRIITDVVEALAFAHQRGVVHRDIKPANIMLLGEHALVIDFGVAKALREAAVPARGQGATSTGMAIGTPAYMAPEQLAADPNADHRVDIYATGLLAYELLKGESPFKADSPQAVLAAQLTRRPDPIAQYRPDIPPALAGIIMHCLEKDPRERPQTADALLLELENTRGSTPGGGSRLDVPPPRTALRRIPAWGIAAAVGGILLAGGLGVWGLMGWKRSTVGTGAEALAPALSEGDSGSQVPVAPATPPVAAVPGTNELTPAESLAIARAVQQQLAALQKAQEQQGAPPDVIQRSQREVMARLFDSVRMLRLDSLRVFPEGFRVDTTGFLGAREFPNPALGRVNRGAPSDSVPIVPGRVLVMEVSNGTGRREYRALAGTLTGLLTESVGRIPGHTTADLGQAMALRRDGMPSRTVIRATGSEVGVSSWLLAENDSLALLIQVQPGPRGFPEVRRVAIPATQDQHQAARDLLRLAAPVVDSLLTGGPTDGRTDGR